MMKDTHVYCKNCTKGEDLIQSIVDGTDIPTGCNDCHPYNPEDSTSHDKRPNYNENRMVKVQKLNTGEIFLMQFATNGVRLYSTTDDTGNSDMTISNEDFNNDFKVLEVLDDTI